MKRNYFSRLNSAKLASCCGTIMRYVCVSLFVMAMSSCNDIMKPCPNYYDYPDKSERQCLNDADSIHYEFDGLCFHSANVVETFNFDNRVFYMVYDDIDAGVDLAVIRLDEETFHLIEERVARQNELEGTLKATRPYESVEYILEVENS